MSKSPIAWLEDVAAHDYDAARNYLSLKFDEKRASEIVDRLKKAELLLRAALTTFCVPPACSRCR